MPEGYEKLRDALKRKGKSDEEAKRMAAAIWNKHHKDNPVTNKPHPTEMSSAVDDFVAHLESTVTFFGVNGLTPVIAPGGRDDKGGQAKVTAYPQKKRKRYLIDTSHLGTGAKVGGVTGAIAGATLGGTTAHVLNKALQSKGILPTAAVVSSAARGARTGGIAGLGLGALIGGAIRKSQERIDREKLQKRSKLFRQLHEINQYERQVFGITLLGIPSADFEAAEKALTDKLGRVLSKAPGAPLPSVQVRAPLPGPLAKYPVNRAPNINAPAPAFPTGEWVDTTKTPANAAAQPSLQDILAHLKKRNSKLVPLPRSKGGTGWFPERGDIRDFAARLVDIEI